LREINLAGHDFSELSAEVLKGGGLLRFTARGFSMRPFILPGDVLTIKPVDPRTLDAGDVVFYRSAQGRPTAHRLVKKYIQGGQLSLATRGDAVVGPPELLQATDVLGRVEGIRRGSKKLNPRAGLYSTWANLWRRLHPLGPYLLILSGNLQKILLSLLTGMQALKLYRILASRLMAEKVSYRLATADDSGALAWLYNYTRFESLADSEKSFADHLYETQQYGYVPVACLGKDILGGIMIRQFPGRPDMPGWWIFGMFVRPRYRGCGIGQCLLETALDFATKQGVQEVNLELIDDQKAALNLYKKMGFRIVDSLPSRPGENSTVHPKSPQMVRMWRSLDGDKNTPRRFVGGQ
jgi:GNAT superfamily N-acetyltransferase